MTALSFGCGCRGAIAAAPQTLGAAHRAAHDQNCSIGRTSGHDQNWSSTPAARRRYPAPVSGWTPPPLPVRWSDPARPAFVGRRAELASFEEVWTAVRAGLRQVVFLGGGPGGGQLGLPAQVGPVRAGPGA